MYRLIPCNIPISKRETGVSQSFEPMNTTVPTNRRRRIRRKTGTRTGARGRRRNNKSQGLEINRADGGYKKITIPWKQLTIGINCFGRLEAVKTSEVWKYYFSLENDNYLTPHKDFNLVTLLNYSSEFSDRLKTSSQYKIRGINISIKNLRVPKGGEMMPDLLMYITTDKVYVNEPKIQSNVMKLNMNALGTKNFNFWLNSENMKKEDTAWQDSTYLYEPIIQLHVGEVDVGKLDEAADIVTIGTMKITFTVQTRIQDYMKQSEPVKKIKLEEQISELQSQVEKLKGKLQEKEAISVIGEEEEKGEKLEH
jgi:hypothetical protein